MDEQKVFFDPTAFDSELLAAVARTGICSDYYALCNQFPNISSTETPKLPTIEILQVASNRIALKKEKGVGRLFGVTDLPLEFRLYFIIQYSRIVETEIVLQFQNKTITTTFAILCNRVTQYAGGGDVLYPRPVAPTVEELITIFVRLREIMLKLATMCI